MFACILDFSRQICLENTKQFWQVCFDIMCVCVLLSATVSQDLGNMVRHSVDYQKLVRNGLSPGRCISLDAAEMLSGLPRNWTSPQPGLVNAADVAKHFPEGQAFQHARMRNDNDTFSS